MIRTKKTPIKISYCYNFAKDDWEDRFVIDQDGKIFFGGILEENSCQVVFLGIKEEDLANVKRDTRMFLTEYGEANGSYVVYHPMGEYITMDIDTAKEIVAKMGDLAVMNKGGQELDGISLVEMMMANRMLENYKEPTENGFRQFVNCDDRLIAAMYTFANYEPREVILADHGTMKVLTMLQAK